MSLFPESTSPMPQSPKSPSPAPHDPAPQGRVDLHGLQLEIAGVSEQGPRSENQDAFSVDAFAGTGIVAVADGMGGEKGGRLAADTALHALESSGPIRSMDDLRRAVRNADAQVARAAEQDPAERAGMGCALGVLVLTTGHGDGVRWIGAHVGDVRIISRSPDGAVRLETRDHTPAFARWEAGEISLDEIPDTAGANRLQRAVGRGGEADVTWLPARPGWSWLIISDGVYKEMRLDELGEVMGMPSAAAACDAIRRKVAERGPDDNYTAVLVRALGGGTARGAAVTATAPVSIAEHTDPMIHPSRPASAPPPERSGSSVIPLLIAIVALLLAGYALWAAQWGGARRVERVEGEMAQLRSQLDSVRGQVAELREPFGPANPGLAPADSAPAGARTGASPLQQSPAQSPPAQPRANQR